MSNGFDLSKLRGLGKNIVETQKRREQERSMRTRWQYIDEIPSGIYDCEIPEPDEKEVELFETDGGDIVLSIPVKGVFNGKLYHIAWNFWLKRENGGQSINHYTEECDRLLGLSVVKLKSQGKDDDIWIPQSMKLLPGLRFKAKKTAETGKKPNLRTPDHKWHNFRSEDK